MEKIKRVLFEEPTCLKKNMFDISKKTGYIHWKELVGCCFLMFEKYMLLLSAKKTVQNIKEPLLLGKLVRYVDHWST